MHKKTKPLYWIIGLPVGIALYLYDDILWGPIPIAFANYWLDWPNGLIALGLVYLSGSFIACSLILRHYDHHPSRTKPAAWLKTKQNKRRSVVYSLLLAGKWVGLAASCFVFGAILTAIPVGKFRLFPEVNRVLLSAIMSLLFVLLFLGFYGGLFTILLKQGIWRTLALALALIIATQICVRGRSGA